MAVILTAVFAKLYWRWLSSLVAQSHSEMTMHFASRLFSHSHRASARWSFALKLERRCWIQSVPPGVAGGLLMRRAILLISLNSDDPPATAGGTECVEAERV